VSENYGIFSKLLWKLQVPVVLNDCVQFVCRLQRSSWQQGVSVTRLQPLIRTYMCYLCY